MAARPLQGGTHFQGPKAETVLFGGEVWGVQGRPPLTEHPTCEQLSLAAFFAVQQHQKGDMPQDRRSRIAACSALRIFVTGRLLTPASTIPTLRELLEEMGAAATRPGRGEPLPLADWQAVMSEMMAQLITAARSHDGVSRWVQVVEQRMAEEGRAARLQVQAAERGAPQTETQCTVHQESILGRMLRSVTLWWRAAPFHEQDNMWMQLRSWVADSSEWWAMACPDPKAPKQVLLLETLQRLRQAAAAEPQQPMATVQSPSLGDLHRLAAKARRREPLGPEALSITDGVWKDAAEATAWLVRAQYHSDRGEHHHAVEAWLQHIDKSFMSELTKGKPATADSGPPSSGWPMLQLAALYSSAGDLHFAMQTAVRVAELGMHSGTVELVAAAEGVIAAVRLRQGDAANAAGHVLRGLRAGSATAPLSLLAQVAQMCIHHPLLMAPLSERLSPHLPRLHDRSFGRIAELQREPADGTVIGVTGDQHPHAHNERGSTTAVPRHMDVHGADPEGMKREASAPIACPQAAWAWLPQADGVRGEGVGPGLSTALAWRALRGCAISLDQSVQPDADHPAHALGWDAGCSQRLLRLLRAQLYDQKGLLRLAEVELGLADLGAPEGSTDLSAVSVTTQCAAVVYRMRESGRSGEALRRLRCLLAALLPQPSPPVGAVDEDAASTGPPLGDSARTPLALLAATYALAWHALREGRAAEARRLVLSAEGMEATEAPTLDHPVVFWPLLAELQLQCLRHPTVQDYEEALGVAVAARDRARQCAWVQWEAAFTLEIARVYVQSEQPPLALAFISAAEELAARGGCLRVQAEAILLALQTDVALGDWSAAAGRLHDVARNRIGALSAGRQAEVCAAAAQIYAGAAAGWDELERETREWEGAADGAPPAEASHAAGPSAPRGSAAPFPAACAPLPRPAPQRRGRPSVRVLWGVDGAAAAAAAATQWAEAAERLCCGGRFCPTPVEQARYAALTAELYQLRVDASTGGPSTGQFTAARDRAAERACAAARRLHRPDDQTAPTGDPTRHLYDTVLQAVEHMRGEWRR
eukprot:TRINITY_DN12654_c0_g1_i1.p1 TRINITY_DN12654_c0_g1~~TRINITY_DN12654_c0_g1_i1.p1  ORF type:complete len:1075 (+),score=248.29 TRINITY_DN12654_c0_g1_i1:84-3227(+)